MDARQGLRKIRILVTHYVDLIQPRVFLLGDTGQMGLVSHQQKGGKRRRHAHIQGAWTTWGSRRPPGSAKKVIDQPDTIALQLMRAGNIDINAGPIALSNSRSKPDSKVAERISIGARNHSGPQMDPTSCRGCTKFTRRNAMTCNECSFHNIYTEETRFAIKNDPQTQTIMDVSTLQTRQRT